LIEAGVTELRGLQKTADVSIELLDRNGLRDYLLAVASDTDHRFSFYGAC
jgi:hypothetical protein